MCQAKQLNFLKRVEISHCDFYNVSISLLKLVFDLKLLAILFILSAYLFIMNIIFDEIINIKVGVRLPRMMGKKIASLLKLKIN